MIGILDIEKTIYGYHTNRGTLHAMVLSELEGPKGQPWYDRRVLCRHDLGRATYAGRPSFTQFDSAVFDLTDRRACPKCVKIVERLIRHGGSVVVLLKSL